MLAGVLPPSRSFYTRQVQYHCPLRQPGPLRLQLTAHLTCIPTMLHQQVMERYLIHGLPLLVVETAGNFTKWNPHDAEATYRYHSATSGTARYT